jgi:hypothetical protein
MATGIEFEEHAHVDVSSVFNSWYATGDAVASSIVVVGRGDMMKYKFGSYVTGISKDSKAL